MNADQIESFLAVRNQLRINARLLNKASKALQSVSDMDLRMELAAAAGLSERAALTLGEYMLEEL